MAHGLPLGWGSEGGHVGTGQPVIKLERMLRDRTVHSSFHGNGLGSRFVSYGDTAGYFLGMQAPPTL